MDVRDWPPLPERIASPHPLRGNRAFGTICAVMIFLPCWGVLWVLQDRAVWLMGGTKEGSCVGGSAPAQGAKEAYGDDLMKERTMGRYAMRRLLVAAVRLRAQLRSVRSCRRCLSWRVRTRVVVRRRRARR